MLSATLVRARPSLRSLLSPGRATSVRCFASASTDAGKSRVVRVAHILVKHDDAGQALLKEAEAKLASGAATFEALAASMSECSSKTRGGELGWLKPASFFPDFEKVAFALPVNGTGRATTPRGLHLLKILQERYAICVRFSRRPVS